MLRSPLTAAGLLLAALVVAALTLERQESWRQLQRIAASGSVPGEAVGSTRFGRALGELGLLHAIPRGRRPDAPAASLGPIPARRGSTPDQLTLAAPGGHHLRAAYRLDGVELAERVPTLSLLVPRDDLREMLADPHLRGRQSERGAFLGVFDHGELLLGTGTGVRIHGGRSRDRRPWKSYRLTARRRYGAPSFSPAPFPESAETAAAQLVLRANRGRDRQHRMWYFTSPLSLDIARRAGVPAPRSRPILFLLNGLDQGVYELTEYIGAEFVEARHGLRDFALVRTKQNTSERNRSKVKEGPEEPYDEFQQRVRRRARESPERAGEWVDLENLYRWIVAVTFLDTRDVFQGALVRDLAEPAARWFWIAWDLDISFGLPHLPAQDGWRTNSVGRMLRTKRADERRSLFDWLMKSPAQRRRFVELATEILNHRLDAAFLSQRVAFYRDQAELFGLEDRRFLDELEDYLRNRPAAYRRHLGELFDPGPARSVVVTGPPGSRLEIDGHPSELPWRGEYFNGMTVRLAAPAGTGVSVNGVPLTLGADPLRLTLREDLEVAL